MELHSLKGCRLSIGSYPYFLYDASGGGGKASVFETTEKNSKYLRFCSKTFQIPPLSRKTTKFLTLSLPPGIVINMSMDKLEGKINLESGEIILNFEAKFTLKIFSSFKFPNLIIKSVLNTGSITSKSYQSQGLRRQKDGRTKLVGIATVLKTNNFILDNLLFLPTEALAELECRII